jgi:hypothetical protein
MDAMVERAMNQRMAATESIIKSQVGLHFRDTVRVDIRRPRWMPDRMYRWLMRTIVVESHR